MQKCLHYHNAIYTQPLMYNLFLHAQSIQHQLSFTLDRNMQNTVVIESFYFTWKEQSHSQYFEFLNLNFLLQLICILFGKSLKSRHSISRVSDNTSRSILVCQDVPPLNWLQLDPFILNALLG
jgi:hypothetical protein